MSSTVYFKFCSKEIEIASHSNSAPKSRFSKCYDKNLDVIMLVAAILLAAFAVLSAYGYLPIQNPMYFAGCFATAASFVVMWGIINMLTIRGCIIVKTEDNPEQLPDI